ncbi:flagellar basal body rod protein FlgC [Vulcanibacillus modesticaldus]|uniref:Flagellar basal-body rod protein FlgC n=1 Tax=Vulcanibacillus modesticaldus TaxID=337097 RepID=A0A1D2YXP2_9BACI|nr:flagellar basal body rod protein FlgC [Vulcanibacillus modesticaldus]OEG00397.1 flagellar basal body rod protein FlgC [Vulcanibacillus modesticaldus]
MKLFNAMDISASALTVQRLRMDVISSNIANAETTRGKYVDGKWQPYTRKMVEVAPNSKGGFKQIFNQVLNNEPSLSGVKVTRIVEDRSPYKKIYQPSHPDADENGFIYLPNVDVLKEMVDMISATRAYEANVTALNSTKSMLLKALEIGR